MIKMDFCLKYIFTVIFIFIFKFSFCHSSLDYPYNKISQPLPQLPERVIESVTPPKPGWVDPFDILGESYSQDSLIVQSDVEIHALQKRCDNHEIYLRRFVNLFLNAVQLTSDTVFDDSLNLVKLEFWIDGKDTNILKKFGQGGSNAPKIEFVSEVFTKIFSQKTAQEKNVSSFSNFIAWSQRAVLKILNSPEWSIISSILLMLSLTLWLVYKTYSYRLAMFTVLLTIFLAGFGFTWIRMYEEKEVERYVHYQMHGGTVPRHCSSEAQWMAWYEHMFYRMFGVDCHEFYKSRDVRPIVKISPTDVLAETFSSMIINPATNIGKAYGNFISSIMGSVPWWLKPVALPCSIIVPVLFVVILLAFLCNYRFSLSITGFHLIPSSWGHTPLSDMRKDRQYVEDCTRSESSSEQKSVLSSILDKDTPLFLMNWKGLKKLSSTSLLSEKNEKSQKEEEKKATNDDDQSLTDENEIMMDDLEMFGKLIDSLEHQKAIEERKVRVTTDSSAEAESSLTNRRSDLKSASEAAFSDLPSNERNSTSTNTDSRKDFKDKTT